MIKYKYINDSCFGIERETLRVDSHGRLSQKPHPFTDKRLSKDFCENQLEIITPVCSSVEQAVNTLKILSIKARAELKKNREQLWFYSNPPYIEGENEIPVAEFIGEESHKHDYRLKLEQRYGKRLMLFSGIHFNMSFSEKYFNECKVNKNDFYLRLLKQSMCHSWLLVMLTAASPLYDKSFDSDGESGFVPSGYSSVRSSKRGYWNKFVPILDYSSIRAFCDSVQMYIDNGSLISEAELYFPVRIKNSGANCLKNLRSQGVDHIELRMFDLNPLAEEGIFQQDLEFAYYLMVYLASLPDFEFTPQMQKEAVVNHKNAARFDLSDVTINGENIITAAKNILSNMENYYADDKKASAAVEYQQKKLENDNFYAKIIYRDYLNKISRSLVG